MSDDETKTIAETDVAIEALLRSLNAAKGIENGVLRTLVLHRIVDSLQRKQEPVTPPVPAVPRWNA